MSPLMDDVPKVLREARALIANPDHWIKGQRSQRNEKGEDCYCAIGALAETAIGPVALYIASLNRLLAAIPPDRPWHVPTFNDDPSTTHEDILALFDRAIDSESGKATPE